MGDPITIKAYRVCRWIDTSRIAEGVGELPFLYGVEAKVAGKRGWHHMAEGSEALLFKEAAEAEAWIVRNPVGPTKGRFASTRPVPALAPSLSERAV